MLKYFENVRLVRMAGGEIYKLIRDLGFLKKGERVSLREPILTINLQVLRPSGKMNVRVPLFEPVA
ncbi:hypothetical protein, partial [Serratia marcescens]|uniref:hypothetical protein n=1 Tax=Serratia marcescens TaxID=615 RepID=UPI002812A82A